MSSALRVPDDGPWFEGHFPGRPILPGIAALALIADALGRGPIRSVRHARFRSTIAPGEILALDVKDGESNALRVSVSRGGATVMSADLAFEAPAWVPPAGRRETTPYPAPPLDELLPHRPPMRFVTGVLACAADGASCVARVPGACALVRDARAPAVAVLEAAAQTAAVWEALRRGASGEAAGPRQGYLVSLRDVALFRADVPVETDLVTAVRLEAIALPLTHYRADVSLDGEVVMTGTIATVLA